MKTYRGKSLKKMASKDDGIFLASIANGTPFTVNWDIPNPYYNLKGGQN